LEELAAACPEKTLVVGFVECSRGNLYNAAAVIRAGRIVHVYHKSLLPNTSVFDEQRYFKPGSRPLIIDIEGLRVALTICQDIWDKEWLAGFFAGTPPFDLMVNISASPFHVNKIYQRCEVVADCANLFHCAVAYCNLVGGQDELVFDGRSMLVDSTGQVVTKAKAFEEDLLIADVARASRPCIGEHGQDARATVEVRPLQPPAPQPKDEVEEVYQALVLGTRDYALKNGFQQVLLGLSGGIDSAVTAAVAAAALGPENVICVTMPSRFNSPETIADAKLAADNLGCPLLTMPIEPILKPFN
jgi:NAD+ synthase (glutamine-hydrolysing)